MAAGWFLAVVVLAVVVVGSVVGGRWWCVGGGGGRFRLSGNYNYYRLISHTPFLGKGLRVLY